MDYFVHHMLQSSARRLPDKEALVHGEERLNYIQVDQQAGGVASGLCTAGAGRGDRIAIFLGPSVAQVLSIFGISRAGAVFVPINEALLADQVRHIATDCSIKGLITDAARLSMLVPILDQIPTLEFVIVVDGPPADGISLPTYDFDRLRELPPLTTPDIGSEKDLAAILYTSGSTGKPKGIMLSHANILSGATIVSTYLQIQESERILAVLPFSFDAGLNQLTTAFQQGATIVLMTFVFAREIVRKLQSERITALAGVPTLWSLLAQPNSTLHKVQLPHLRYITNTGGAMPQSVLATLRDLLPATEVFLMYGLTEAFRSTYLPPAELDRRPTSIGKAIPNTEILVINNAGQPCAPGEVGELVHCGPTVSLGYWNRAELNAERFRPHPFRPPEMGCDERVCYSGDLVKMDADGFLYFVSRRDAMIKSMGYRISPTEVEEVLFQSGKLRGAAVIGLPDEVLGQRIKAFVVPRPDTAVDVTALLDFCGERLPRFMVPKDVEVVESLPQNGNGKVDYPTLRRLANGEKA
jgi:acyl-CoA ligase (AMP-forming) (exosortase A-associated)